MISPGLEAVRASASEKLKQRSTFSELWRTSGTQPIVVRAGFVEVRRVRRLVVSQSTQVPRHPFACGDGARGRRLSWSLFEAQEESYRESVLPRGIRKRVTVEAASPIGWHRWAGDEDAFIGVERFGASAPGQDVLKHLGFTADRVAAAALRLLESGSEATLVTA
jgi:hypothetical protein